MSNQLMMVSLVVKWKMIMTVMVIIMKMMVVMMVLTMISWLKLLMIPMTCPSALRQSLNFDFGDFRDKVYCFD
ncbi:hypothetical protein OIU76_025262 [Salix suchowensis]|nr:hypothetical protein OIU76_025262 [Salix suchowensis]